MVEFTALNWLEFVRSSYQRLLREEKSFSKEITALFRFINSAFSSYTFIANDFSNVISTFSKLFVVGILRRLLGLLSRLRLDGFLNRVGVLRSARFDRI